MTDLTNKRFDTAATFMTMAAKTCLAAVNEMRQQTPYYKVETWDLENSGETVYIMEIMIAHLRNSSKKSEYLHNEWVESEWARGVQYGPDYVADRKHPKLMQWQSLIIPAKIELDMIRGIVSCVVRAVVDHETISDYITALDSATDKFMTRTVN